MYGKPSPHGLRFIAPPSPAALGPAYSDQGRKKPSATAQQEAVQAVRTYASTRIYTGYRGTWCRYMVMIEELTAKLRLQTHYAMSRDRDRRRRSTKQKDGRVSDPLRRCTRQPQIAVSYFSCLSRRSGPSPCFIYLLAATILYRAAACRCCCC